MKIRAFRTAAIKAVAGALMILTFVFTFAFAFILAAPPCVAQYTKGHAIESKSNTEDRIQPALLGTSCDVKKGVNTSVACGGQNGPQGEDATVISGLNAVGTVRVNMLANLEALLNIAANCGEIVAILWGLVLLCIALKSLRVRNWHKIFTAILLIKVGLSIPECVNWMVATARDANLFS